MFPDWQSVENWGIPLPGKLAKIANDAMRVVYFLGPVINFAVLQARKRALNRPKRALHYLKRDLHHLKRDLLT